MGTQGLEPRTILVIAAGVIGALLDRRPLPGRQLRQQTHRQIHRPNRQHFLQEVPVSALIAIKRNKKVAQLEGFHLHSPCNWSSVSSACWAWSHPNVTSTT